MRHGVHASSDRPGTRATERLGETRVTTDQAAHAAFSGRRLLRLFVVYCWDLQRLDWYVPTREDVLIVVAHRRAEQSWIARGIY